MSDLREGTYIIKNVLYPGSAIDLSGSDGVTVSGWHANGGANQEWKADYGVDSSDNSSMFLLHGEGNLTVVSKDPGTPLQFSSQGDKFKWRITRVDPKNIYQISHPDDSGLLLEMTDSSGPDGIPIVLNSKSDSLSPRQMWEFTPT